MSQLALSRKENLALKSAPLESGSFWTSLSTCHSVTGSDFYKNLSSRGLLVTNWDGRLGLEDSQLLDTVAALAWFRGKHSTLALDFGQAAILNKPSKSKGDSKTANVKEQCYYPAVTKLMELAATGASPCVIVLPEDRTKAKPRPDLRIALRSRDAKRSDKPGGRPRRQGVASPLLLDRQVSEFEVKTALTERNNPQATGQALCYAKEALATGEREDHLNIVSDFWRVVAVRSSCSGDDITKVEVSIPFKMTHTGGRGDLPVTAPPGFRFLVEFARALVLRDGQDAWDPSSALQFSGRKHVALLRVIAHGRNSLVLEGRLDDQPVAIKVVAKPNTLEEAAHALIDGPVAATTKLVSSGAVQMDDGEKYECFAFTPVGVAFSSGALVDKPAEARQLFREVLATLKEAHQYVFHRDVKPQNLLRVDAEGKATVVTNDWGLAIPVDDALPGDRCGTLRYSSPALSSSAHSYGVEDDFAGLVLTVVDLVRPDWISWSAGQDDIAQQKRQLFAASQLDSLLDDDAWRDLVVGLRAHFREDAIV
jgi:hypothetical protein